MSRPYTHAAETLRALEDYPPDAAQAHGLQTLAGLIQSVAPQVQALPEGDHPALDRWWTALQRLCLAAAFLAGQCEAERAHQALTRLHDDLDSRRRRIAQRRQTTAERTARLALTRLHVDTQTAEVRELEAIQRHQPLLDGISPEGRAGLRHIADADPQAELAGVDAALRELDDQLESLLADRLAHTAQTDTDTLRQVTL